MITSVQLWILLCTFCTGFGAGMLRLRHPSMMSFFLACALVSGGASGLLTTCLVLYIHPEYY